MNADVFKKLKQLRNFLAYHKAVGIEEYRCSDDIETFLRNQFDLFSESNGQNDRPGKAMVNSAGEPEVDRQEETIAELCEEICRCTSCALAQKRIQPVCGFGGKRVKLFIVGSWLTADHPQVKDKTTFGCEEDEMLEKMLQAIHLSSADTFVTNVIKCGIANTVQPQAMHIATCISYLERQIAVTSPLIICTMGTVATRALLKVKQPLSQLRGTFHEYFVGENKTIPLMPTYHPSFLLKNPEMKRPTWSDLQQIEKALVK